MYKQIETRNTETDYGNNMSIVQRILLAWSCESNETFTFCIITAYANENDSFETKYLIPIINRNIHHEL